MSNDTFYITGGEFGLPAITAKKNDLLVADLFTSTNTERRWVGPHAPEPKLEENFNDGIFNNQ